MFSSTNNVVNPFLHLSSSSPYINDHETTNDSFLYHHHHHHHHHSHHSNHHNPLPIPLLTPPTNPLQESLVLNMLGGSNSCAMMSNDNKLEIGVLHHHQYDPCNLHSRKRPTGKKDRHSKICTAQGLRDRRVRLSIEIARKFFDLQDMLGFDRASKTLDWLFTKSRKAIKELAKNGGGKSLSPSSTFGEVSGNDDDDDDLERIFSKTQSLLGVSDEKKLKKAEANLLVKESRAKARARARERTIVKMSTRRLHESKKCPDQTSPNDLNQSRSLNQYQICDKSGSYRHNGITSSLKVFSHEIEEPRSSHSLVNQAPKRNVIEESIVISRKIKPSTLMGYQQNLVMLKDLSCNNNSSSSSNNNSVNLPQNWDISSAIARSSFCAITNRNPSTGLQL